MGTTDLTDVAGARDAVEDVARNARKRLDVARHDLADRAGTAQKQLRERLDDVDLEPQVRRAKIGFWGAIRALVGALVAVPGAAARGLGALSVVADEAAERGSELSARSREIARAVPITRRQRRRARTRTAAWSVGGFVVGVAAGAVGGFLLARRKPELVDEARELAVERTERARAAVSGAAERAKSVAEDALATGRDSLDTVVEEGRSNVTDGVGRAEEATVGAIDEVQGAVVDATEQAKAASHGAARRAEDATEAVAERAGSDNGEAGTGSSERGSGR